MNDFAEPLLQDSDPCQGLEAQVLREARPNDTGVCEQRVRRLLKEFSRCHRPSELLEILAAKLQTRFEVFHSESELLAIKARYVAAGEKRFATLEREFPAEVFGITFRRLSRKPWEPEYVSVIDCTGDKKYWANYTKWHELAHLLVLTDQMRISFSRTFCTQDLKDPEESLVDVIAGHFAFWPPLFAKETAGAVGFDRIEQIRLAVCPEASKQSALLGIVKAWQNPCLLLEARLALKKAEQQSAAQIGFSFKHKPTAALRVSNVTANGAADDIGLRIHRQVNPAQPSSAGGKSLGFQIGKATARRAAVPGHARCRTLSLYGPIAQQPLAGQTFASLYVAYLNVAHPS